MREDSQVGCETSQYPHGSNQGLCNILVLVLKRFSADHLGGAWGPLGLHCQEAYEAYDRTGRMSDGRDTALGPRFSVL